MKLKDWGVKATCANVGVNNKTLRKVLNGEVPQYGLTPTATVQEFFDRWIAGKVDSLFQWARTYWKKALQAVRYSVSKVLLHATHFHHRTCKKGRAIEGDRGLLWDVDRDD